MKQYLKLLENIYYGGVSKKPYREREKAFVTDTIGLSAQTIEHDMSNGFPLLTTKKMSLKNIAVELEGFIKGITSKKWFQDRGCHIWDEWANPRKVKDKCHQAFTNGQGFGINTDPILDASLKKQIQLDEDDLGPIYGYQWRKFNQCYDENDSGWVETRNHFVDQLKTIADQLRSNPHDRRMVCSAWNPCQIEYMALPPCHLIWNVVVYGNTLNLLVYMRSADVGLGIPYNIASYGLLLLLLAKHSNLEPGILHGTLGDAHIYTNHMDAIYEQIKRTPYDLPKLTIPNNDGDSFDIFKWDHTQLQLEGYKHHPAIKMEITI